MASIQGFSLGVSGYVGTGLAGETFKNITF